MKRALYLVVQRGWIPILAFMMGIVEDQYVASRPHTMPIFLVTSDAEAARQSLFNCGNISIDTREQADAYAERRPGEHVFEIKISELR
jgi:hypothetical protein